ncbi:MAG: hypothetical protein ACNA8W_10460 [Bradymonadaceae bacterium]
MGDRVAPRIPSQMLDLSIRATAACKGRFIEGMLFQHVRYSCRPRLVEGYTCGLGRHAGFRRHLERWLPADEIDTEEYLLVIDDPGTVGCLAFLAREALGDPQAYAVPHTDWWSIRLGRGFDMDIDYSEKLPGSEVEAWVAALEAVAKRSGEMAG